MKKVSQLMNECINHGCFVSRVFPSVVPGTDGYSSNKLLSANWTR